MEQGYEAMSRQLGLHDSELAEVHGTLTGLVCSGLSPNDAAWAAFVEEHWAPLLEEDRRKLLEGLYAQVEKDLAAGDLGFELLVPGDEQDFFQRAQCLGLWSNGLLYGLSQVKPERLNATDSDVRGQMQDLAEIGSRLTAIADEFQPTEEDEEDLAEIHEYLRSLAQSLFFDLHQSSVRQPLLQ